MGYWGVQFDDMWVSEGSHVLEFTSHTGLCLFSLDDGFGYVLHGDGVAGYCVCGHWYEDQPLLSGTGGFDDALLTFPKVPSAMSEMTVYSPSFDGGYIVMSSIVECDRVGFLSVLRPGSFERGS